MKLGTIILAAGAGTRLGKGPKALIEIGGKTLLEWQVQKSGKHVIVLTSEQNHEAIDKKIDELSYGHVATVVMPLRSCENKPDYKLPMGNGAVYECVYKSDAYMGWQNEGVTHIAVIFIDNPLAEPLDPELIGGDLTVVAVTKQDPKEKMGSVFFLGNSLKVVEYFEIDEEARRLHMLGYAGTFMMSNKLFETAAKFDLPWHEIKRNGLRCLEKFVFDAFPLAKKPRILLKSREEAFAPIKVESDIAIAEDMLYNQRKRKKDKELC